MKQIPLTQGQFAVVDDADFEWLSQFKWYARLSRDVNSFYAMRNVRLETGTRATEQMHRVILGLNRGDKRQGDHINHATLDNRRVNIRIVTQSENMQNRRAKGYSWNTASKKYHARIMVNSVNRNLGLYDTREEARAAYVAAKRVYHPTATISEASCPDVLYPREARERGE